MSEASGQEMCPECHSPARRVYTPVGITYGQGMWEWDDMAGTGSEKRRVENGLGDTLIHNW